MKKNDLIPQYLRDEFRSLVRVKATYTTEEINQVKRDYEDVREQLRQLKEAEKYGAIPEEEAAITNLTLLVMKYIIDETISDIMRYLQEQLETAKEEMRELERGS